MRAPAFLFCFPAFVLAQEVPLRILRAAGRGRVSKRSASQQRRSKTTQRLSTHHCISRLFSFGSRGWGLGFRQSPISGIKEFGGTYSGTPATTHPCLLHSRSWDEEDILHAPWYHSLASKKVDRGMALFCGPAETFGNSLALS